MNANGTTSTYLNILILLQFEHVGIELLLQLLVGVIDAELLEGVYLECLETVNIKYTWRRVK